MFNRALQVKVVKETKTEPEKAVPSDSYFEKRADVISHMIESTMKKAGALAIGYVIIDTARQVLVARANRY